MDFKLAKRMSLAIVVTLFLSGSTRTTIFAILRALRFPRIRRVAALGVLMLFYMYTKLVHKVDKLKLEYHSKMTEAVHMSQLAGTEFKLGYWN